LFILGAVGLKQMVRFDGSVDGSGKPRVVWRWTAKKSGNVGDFKAVTVPKEQAGIEAAIDYPGYLGRDRSGVVLGIQLERDWTSHPPQELWRQPIGLGWSAFAVSGPFAVTQEQRGENELVVCYSLSTKARCRPGSSAF